MASANKTPKVSRITRDRTVAYARKQKPGAGSDAPSEPTDAAALAEAEVAEADAASSPDPATAAPTDVTAPMRAVTEPRSPASAPTSVTAPMTAVAPPVEPSDDAPPVEPSDDAPPDRPRARQPTVAMPIQTSIGAPPAMPAEALAATTPIDPEVAESPTRMPGPREIPGGSPDDPASPPGATPSGDSRSMRRRAERYEFGLVYRIQTYVISRFGVVGTRGQWRVVEYPTSASASHAYAKEVSRFVSEGFSDYRE